MRRVDERGSALLVALGMLVLLSIMGITFVMLTRMEMQAAINFDDITRARFLAETGLQRAVAELRALYVGPVFRPRFDYAPPTTGLNFLISKPYSATVAAHPSETWGVRAVGLANPATYTSLESMVMPNPVSAESAPYLWSGPQRGRLADGYFDARFRGVGRLDAARNPYVDASTGQTFRIVGGVVDLSGLVNVNRADFGYPSAGKLHAFLLEGLLTYFGIANAQQVADNIVTSKNGEDDNGNGVLDPGEDTNGNGVLDTAPFRYLRELVDRGLLTLPQLYGEDANGNGALDPGEDTNGNGVLDGALRDAITVFPMTGAVTAANSAINVNTAPEPVLFAVFYRVLGGNSANALGLARAVIAYRAGADRIEGARSERDPNGDGNPADAADLTGDGDGMAPDDLYCDDNPFDGIFDLPLVQLQFPAFIPAGAFWLFEFAAGAGEWQDIDGDTVPPGLVSGASRSLDRWLFPNGPGGFSEFEYLMDNFTDPSPWFPGLGLSQQDVDYVKYNATPRDDVTYPPTPPPAPRVVTAVFRYDSEDWLVISEGRVERGGELQALVTMSAFVGYQ